MSRDLVGRLLLALCALAALVALGSELPTVAQAGAATRQVETWRAFGFALFAGLFALLAWRPRTLPALWELVILDKAGLTVAEALLVPGGAVEAASSAVIDGMLTLTLVAAYVLCRGYTAWIRRPTETGLGQRGGR